MVRQILEIANKILPNCKAHTKTKDLHCQQLLKWWSRQFESKINDAAVAFQKLVLRDHWIQWKIFIRKPSEKFQRKSWP